MTDNDSDYPAETQEHIEAIEDAVDILQPGQATAFQVTVMRPDFTTETHYHIHDVLTDSEDEVAGQLLQGAVRQVGHRLNLDLPATLNFVERFDAKATTAVDFDPEGSGE